MEVIFCASVTGTQGKRRKLNGDQEGTAAKKMYFHQQGLVSEKNTNILECIRKEDCQRIEGLLKEGKIPTKMITMTAMKEFRYNKSTQCLLRGMSNVLKEAVPNATAAWCGYRPSAADSPVFVVTLTDQRYTLDRKQIPKQFDDYNFIVRYKNVPNDEEIKIFEKTGEKIVRADDAARVHQCIAKETELLMTEHSNLSIIKASPVKACGYLNKDLELKEQTCIVFSVPVKGIIPIGEKEFCKSIGGIATDVREGEFVLFGRHRATEYHDKLRMGCSILRPEVDLYGTLGGFVDLPGDKVGCLTAAHVVLTQDEIQKYTHMTEEMKSVTNNHLKEGKLNFALYQPKADSNAKSFGKVHTIALQKGNRSSPSVDASIIQITDVERKPDAGNFPEGDFTDIGFTMSDPMMYTSGDILDDISSIRRGCLVIKYGRTTGITKSRSFRWIGTSARQVDVWGKYSFPVLYGQLEITSSGFAEEGDSGALVFLCLGGNVNNVHAVGIVVGGNTTECSTFITPISDIFQELKLSEKRFKIFPTRQLQSDRNISQQLAEINDNLTVRLDNLTTKIDALSDKLCNDLENVNNSMKKLSETLIQALPTSTVTQAV